MFTHACTGTHVLWHEVAVLASYVAENSAPCVRPDIVTVTHTAHQRFRPNGSGKHSAGVYLQWLNGPVQFKTSKHYRHEKYCDINMYKDWLCMYTVCTPICICVWLSKALLRTFSCTSLGMHTWIFILSSIFIWFWWCHIAVVLMTSYYSSDDVILQLLFSRSNAGLTPSSAIMCNYCQQLACQQRISSSFSSLLHMLSLSPGMGSVWHKVVSLSMFLTPVSLTRVVSASVSVDWLFVIGCGFWTCFKLQFPNECLIL